MMIPHVPYKTNTLESSNCTCTLMQCLKHITFTLNTKPLHTIKLFKKKLSVFTDVDFGD